MTPSSECFGTLIKAQRVENISGGGEANRRRDSCHLASVNSMFQVRENFHSDEKQWDYSFFFL